MKFIKFIIILFIITVFKNSSFSQSLPVGSTAIEDYYRRSQLTGLTDTNVSFMVRPIFPNFIKNSANPIYPDSTERHYDLFNFGNTDYENKSKSFKFTMLPFSIQTEVNSNHPYDWNDGPMIPAVGPQLLFTGGFFLKYGPLTIQLKPELISAENTSFSTFNPNQYAVLYARYYDIYNNIDLPVRFGETAYNRAYLGQSSIRLNYKSWSAGLSTENLWWGPGIRNSLLMSNTAPGFIHFTLNTVKPIQTPIGSFEGQLIAGRLGNSGFPPLEPTNFDYLGTDLYVPKPNVWRYLSGIVVTWQPRWVPGLFLGFDQSSQTYGNELSGIKGYLPIFSQIKSVSAPNTAINAQDQISSTFMRWLWPQEHAEIYFEWGLYNNNQDFLQTLLEPNNSRAYIFGVRKLLPSAQKNNGNILIGVEVTQLQENSISNIESGKEWYVSQNIRQGYTNQGQELGAGIGPGGNLQTVDVSWVKGLKKIGLQFERYVHNDDFYYYAFEDSQDYSNHWVDLSLAATVEWNYKNIIFNAKVMAINSLDYQWALKKMVMTRASSIKQARLTCKCRRALHTGFSSYD